MYHTIARGGADGEQNGIFCAYCFFRNNARKDFSVDTPCSQSHGERTSNFCLIFSTPRLAKRMAALNLATVTSMPATNKACRDAASTESKCLYSWLDSGMQIWDQQPELWRRRGSWKYQRVSNVSVYRCHGDTEPGSNRRWPRQSLDLSAEKYMGGGKRTREKDLHWQRYRSLYSRLWYHSAQGWTTAISGLFYRDQLLRPFTFDAGLQQRHNEYLEDPNSKPIYVSISSEDTSENPRALRKVKRVAN